MSALLKLLAGVLVLVRRTQYGHDLLLRGERDGARYASTGALCGFDNAFGLLVDYVVFVSLELDADLLRSHFLSSLAETHVNAPGCVPNPYPHRAFLPRCMRFKHGSLSSDLADWSPEITGHRAATFRFIPMPRGHNHPVQT